MSKSLKLSVLAVAALLSACANLAPSYQTPAAPVPAAWPQAVAASAPSGTVAAAPAELDWRDFASDSRLRQTIALALDQSRDLRLAVLAVEQARATYRIQDAAQLPTLKASAGQSVSRTPAQASSSGKDVTSRSYSAGLGVSAFELDFFGRVANLKDAALESYLETGEAKRSAQISLVAEVASAWLTLASDQAQLALARETLDSQRKTYEMTQRRQALGADSGLTVAQTQTSVESARRDVAAYESQVQQDINALNLLAGTSVPEAWLPQAQDGAASAASAALLVGVPAGLPSSLLRQRPDVLAAEHALKASNADIGAARAALYPSISLTASAGTASSTLSNLFKGGAWSFAPSFSLPIFDGGASRAEVQKAEVARDIQLATYDKTVQTAFREVADALATRASLGERLSAQQALTDASNRAYQLAQASWKAGGSSYLDVLDAQRTLYTAQQGLITLRLAEQSNRVTLFKVMGGGWQESTTTASASGS